MTKEEIAAMKEGAQHGEGGYGWGEDMDMEEEEEGGGGRAGVAAAGAAAATASSSAPWRRRCRRRMVGGSARGPIPTRTTEGRGRCRTWDDEDDWRDVGGIGACVLLLQLLPVGPFAFPSVCTYTFFK